MAQAQKMLGLSGLREHTNYVAGLAQASEDPSVWDKFDKDQVKTPVGKKAYHKSFRAAYDKMMKDSPPTMY